jgi:hypothetical protein
MNSLTRSLNSSVSSHDLSPLPATLLISSLSAFFYLRISSKSLIDKIHDPEAGSKALSFPDKNTLPASQELERLL